MIGEKVKLAEKIKLEAIAEAEKAKQEFLDIVKLTDNK